MLMASNLGPVPPNKTYELWLIPAHGAPMPAGTFKPNARGEATMEHQLPPGTEAKAFGVTIENEGGSATPTLPIVLSGSTGL
jgi:anti-sigma-K factor RskA